MRNIPKLWADINELSDGSAEPKKWRNKLIFSSSVTYEVVVSWATETWADSYNPFTNKAHFYTFTQTLLFFITLYQNKDPLGL